jgi:DNA-binding transcriptional ArsR family regulator
MDHPAVVQAARFELSAFGELIAEPSRAAMLLALMDGSSRPATELARIAGVAPSTASEHLRRLSDGGAVTALRSGRHRYFRIASEQVAEALEVLALLGNEPRPAARQEDPARRALAEGRTCYRHLAGRLGVAFLAALERKGFLGVRGGAVILAPAGQSWFEDNGMALPLWPTGKACLDWTERRHHLGGKLGAALTDHLFALRWIARRREGRAVRLTARGSEALERHFGLRV